MIKRLYIDNFKCMVNFEYRPEPLQLVFGSNGTGKSTVFKILANLRDFVTGGAATEQLFPIDTLTAWQSRDVQTFELEIEGNGGLYHYSLVVEHQRTERKSRVTNEQLRFDNKHVYLFDGSEAHLYRDDFSESHNFPVDSSQSGITRIPELADNRILCWFRARLGLIYVFAVDPFRMLSYSEREATSPDQQLANFVSWYRHLAQNSPEKMGTVFESLSHVLDGFQSLTLASVGETARMMYVRFKPGSDDSRKTSEFVIPFHELSEGQRCLIVLHVVLHFAIRENVTVCIDEPDNFIALREMQPWLGELCDRVEDEQGQCLLISHHPEFIDKLAVKHGVCFTRDDAGPVRVKPFEWSKDDGISASETVARGWE